MSNTLRLTGRSTGTGQTTATPQSDDAERRMRRALGLLPGEQAATGDGRAGSAFGVRRHSSSPVNRMAVAEAALAVERRAREDAQRQLRDAEAALHKATTRWGEAEFARDEALKALAAERAAREAAEARLEALPTPSAADEVAPAITKRGRPPGHRVRPARPDDDQPVEWWIPGWRARHNAD
jgi:hypothetical protein